MSEPRASGDLRVATDPFTAAFPAFLAAQRDSDPAWLPKLRQDAFAAFAERGLPTRRLESWKYTSTKPVAELRLDTRSHGKPTDAAIATAVARFVATTGPAHRCVLVDGLVHSNTTSQGSADQGSADQGSADGARVDSLRAVWRNEPDAARVSLAESAPEDHVFAALNTAFLADGVLIRVAAGQHIASPIEVISLLSGANVAAHCRIVIELERGAQATVVESHGSLGTGAALSNVVVDIRLGDGAVLDHVVIADENDSALHVGAVRIDQSGRDSSYRSHVVSIGGAWLRRSNYVALRAPGAHASLDGLYATRGKQQHDHYTVFDHVVPHTTSEQHYKGVLDGKSKGVFFGRVLVRKDAQKTSSSQKNHNLLLSNEALCNSTPQLEIFADDVKCAHGSTIGQLDGQSLFYLRSRGIDKAAARELLTYAFLNEILDRIPLEELRDRLAKRLTGHAQSDRLTPQED